MKKFYIILIVLFAVNNVNAQWVPQNSGTTYGLKSVYFKDANSGIAVGDSGSILKTTDGGTNWVPQNSGTLHSLSSVYFIDDMTGYAVGDSGTILKTTDGGTNWVPQNSGTKYYLSSIHFPAADIGFIAGYGGEDTIKIFKTDNGGVTWIEKYSNYVSSYWGGFLNEIHFPDVNTGYAVGGYYGGSYPRIFYGSRILKTTDGGATWTNTNLGVAVPLSSVFFTDANTGYIVGILGTIKKTTDGGMNWLSQFSGTAANLFSVFFLDANTGYVVGDYGVIRKTTDGGTNWLSQDSNIPGWLSSVHSPGVDTGYVVGINGTILKTTNGGGYPLGVYNQPSTTSTLKIYPNPSSTEVTIETSPTPTIPISTGSHLSIMNFIGQEIITRQITGVKMLIDICNLPNGVYFVRMTNDRTVKVGKIIKQ